MVTRRVGKSSRSFFVEAEDLIHIYDIVAKTYGVLPCQISKLSWEDLSICLQAIKSRSNRMKNVLSRSKRKKDMIFPTIPLSDLIDII
jgi:hypothetical protein